jgi:hypothetical protein
VTWGGLKAGWVAIHSHFGVGHILPTGRLLLTETHETILRATALFNSGRFQSALQVLEVIFQAYPDFPSAGPLHLAILGKR